MDSPQKKHQEKQQNEAPQSPHGADFVQALIDQQRLLDASNQGLETEDYPEEVIVIEESECN